MEVSKLTGNEILDNSPVEIHKPTVDELQREYNFLVTEKVLKKMLAQGIISSDEYTRLRRKFVEIFSTKEARIFPKTP